MASRTNIVLRGPWSWFWGTWHAARLFGAFWGAYVGHWHGLTQEVHLFFLVLYTAFLPSELLGAWCLRYNPPGVEIAKTLSQTNQWLSQQTRFLSNVAVISGALDAALVIMILSPLSPVVGLAAGVALGYYLMPHYADRSMGG